MSTSILIAAIARIHESGILEMFVKVQSAMLETHYGKQLKDAYNESRNGSRVKELKKAAHSVALFLLENLQCHKA